MGVSLVMLSAAKHLSAQRDRPFAALRVTGQGPMYHAHCRFIGPQCMSRYPASFVKIHYRSWLDVRYPDSLSKDIDQARTLLSYQ